MVPQVLSDQQPSSTRPIGTHLPTFSHGTENSTNTLSLFPSKGLFGGAAGVALILLIVIAAMIFLIGIALLYARVRPSRASDHSRPWHPMVEDSIGRSLNEPIIYDLSLQTSRCKEIRWGSIIVSANAHNKNAHSLYSSSPLLPREPLRKLISPYRT